MELRDLTRILRPLYRRVMLATARAVVRAADDSTGAQQLQLAILRGEVRDRIERMGPLGLTAVPLPGSEALVVFIGGNRDHGVVVGVEDRRTRPRNLEPGEVALWCPAAQGTLIHLKADGSILVKGGKLRLEGDLEVTGSVKDKADSGGLSMDEMRTRYNLHVHPDPQGGTTSPPQPLMT